MFRQGVVRPFRSLRSCLFQRSLVYTLLSPKPRRLRFILVNPQTTDYGSSERFSPYAVLSQNRKYSKHTHRGWSRHHAAGVMLGFSLFTAIFGPYEPPEQTIAGLLNKAAEALRSNKITLAENYLNDAFTVGLDNAFEDDMTEMLYLQSNLAFLDSDDGERNELLFRVVMERLLENWDPLREDNEVLEVGRKLGRLYCQSGRTEPATIQLEHCVMLLRKKIKDGANDPVTLLLAARTIIDLAECHAIMRLRPQYGGPYPEYDRYHDQQMESLLKEAHSYYRRIDFTKIKHDPLTDLDLRKAYEKLEYEIVKVQGSEYRRYFQAHYR